MLIKLPRLSTHTSFLRHYHTETKFVFCHIALELK